MHRPDLERLTIHERDVYRLEIELKKLELMERLLMKLDAFQAILTSIDAELKRIAAIPPSTDVPDAVGAQAQALLDEAKAIAPAPTA